jgi:hypothetical protein
VGEHQDQGRPRKNSCNLIRSNDGSTHAPRRSRLHPNQRLRGSERSSVQKKFKRFVHGAHHPSHAAPSPGWGVASNSKKPTHGSTTHQLRVQIRAPKNTEGETHGSQAGASRRLPEAREPLELARAGAPERLGADLQRRRGVGEITTTVSRGTCAWTGRRRRDPGSAIQTWILFCRTRSYRTIRRRGGAHRSLRRTGRCHTRPRLESVVLSADRTVAACTACERAGGGGRAVDRLFSRVAFSSNNYFHNIS